jgi:NADH-quinone oxidoreductase subunit I
VDSVTTQATKRGSYLAEVLGGAWSIGKGLAVTLRNALLRPRVTEPYPAEPPKLPPAWRGKMVHKRGEDGRPRCTACMACQKACPTLAIVEIKGDEKKGRDRRATAYVWDASRCLFCNQCVEACPFDAIELGREYSMVTESREGARFELPELLEPAEEGEP